MAVLYEYGEEKEEKEKEKEKEEEEEKTNQGEATLLAQEPFHSEKTLEQITFETLGISK